MARNDRKRVVLVTRFSALGDIAMALPCVYDAAMANPDNDFIFLTRPHAGKMFLNKPENLTVITIDLDKEGKPKDLIKLSNRLLQDYHITDYADLHDVLRTKIMRIAMRLHGVKTRHLHKDRHSRKALTRRYKKELVQLKPMQQRYADVFKKLGINYTKHFTSLYETSYAAAEDFAAIISRPPEHGEKWIAIAPFAKHPGKIYPLEMMRQVIEGLMQIPDIHLFLLGAGKAETEILEEWRTISPDRITNVAAQKSGLAAEIALMSRCRLVLSMDSANMHLAALAGTRVISIWGATHPYAGFYGMNQNPNDAIELPLPCRPCSIYGNKKCFLSERLCMTRIKPYTVVSKILAQL